MTGGSILCIDKPQDFTSFDVVAKLRGMSGIRRVGHAGTLDPMATGVLPVFFGRATKACDILPVQDKRYTARFQLGLTTDTLDITGRVTSTSGRRATTEEVQRAAASFAGETLQVPPMYSAIRVGGQRLYDLARQGIEVERKPRPVMIYELHLTGADEDKQEFEIDVLCAKGTYIRTLCADIGSTLGTGACVTFLRRTMAAGFTIEQCITLDEAQRLTDEGRLQECFLPVEQAFSRLPSVRLNEGQTRRFLNGAPLNASRIGPLAGLPDTDVSVMGFDGAFLGLGGIDRAADSFKVKKLFAER